MEYFKILNLVKEPFSNSPEPEFFYHSLQHVECLQNLELAIRLRRGLNVVVGEVGTGKTTLCRRIIGKFKDDGDIKTHLILDPYFTDSGEFLSTVADMFGVKSGTPGPTEWQLKEDIKNYLFKKGVDEKNIIVLIVDEGQKIPGFCIELLREFLNYETNQYKLLQIIVFAQKEFKNVLEERENFADRINYFYELGPLSFSDTRKMILHRMERASETGKNPIYFTYPALREIYRATGGYPRKIVTLCHQIMLTFIVRNKTRVTRSLVRVSIERKVHAAPKPLPWAKVAVLSGLVIALVALGISFGTVKRLVSFPFRNSVTAVPQTGKVLPGDETVKRHVPEPFSREGNIGAIQAEVAAGEADLPADTDDVPPSALRYPATLGELAVEEGWIVSRMISRIRGLYKPEYLLQVRLANPHIGNVDHVKSGDVITFPAIPVEGESTPWRCWVEVAEEDNLGRANLVLQEYRNGDLPVRIVPYWSEQNGLKFSILLEDGFMDEGAALKAIDGLPPHISPKARIISTWGGDTVFFAYL